MQCSEPAKQAVVPAEHTPRLPVEQATLPPGLPSSTWPLQLLSRPSQTSALGWTCWLQTTAPAMQAVVPAAHTPRLPVEQATLPPGLPSSVWPLQLSSAPLQVSGAPGWIEALLSLQSLLSAT